MSNWQKSVGKHYILHFMMRFRYQLFHDVPLKKQSNEESRKIILVFSQHHLFLPGKDHLFFSVLLGTIDAKVKEVIACNENFPPQGLKCHIWSNKATKHLWFSKVHHANSATLFRPKSRFWFNTWWCGDSYSIIFIWFLPFLRNHYVLLAGFRRAYDVTGSFKPQGFRSR